MQYVNRGLGNRDGLSRDNSISSVDPEIFARILFSRYALKGIFVTLKIRD